MLLRCDLDIPPIEKWSSTFPSPESEQACDHSESDSVWLLKLDHTLPLLEMLFLGTQPSCCEEAQATTSRDHCYSWQLQLRSQLTAGITSPKMWRGEPSDVKPLQTLNLPSRGPRHHRAETCWPTVPFQIPVPEDLWVLKMVVALRHLVWVCDTATDNHYNCFKQ